MRADPHDQDKELVVLRSAVENTNEAFVTIDGAHRVVFFNRAAEAMFGYSREEVLGRDLDIIMSPRCSNGHREAVERYIRTGVPGKIGHGSELTATRKSGETFPAHISFSVSHVQGRPYFTAIVKDLTETKALEERMARSERLSALGRFVAEITHEIKNSLMLIGGFARQLIRDPSNEKSLKKLEVIAEEVERLENLLRELGEFYNPKPLSPEPMDLNALLRHVYMLVKGDCRERKIRVKLDTVPASLIVNGDRGKLEQVFLNLARNSIESMEEEGELIIRSRAKGDRAEVTVSDNGCGIPPEDMEKIFSPFFTTKREGSGLGLSISKRIVEEHEGSTFSLKSEPGKGTSFTITMPLQQGKNDSIIP
ncbi:MAG: PAS domain S-box protein [Deltaproteobacteria bacterium]|nr:PAS domain S-box protein [Deltaproteobacteria bacterium]MBW2128383.1 PAS domain S-box protein [Deltaproteobacteria bacterium]MBW2304915.1 PAS domain S-box protein [Deltaproteobacteria bacterium]